MLPKTRLGKRSPLGALLCATPEPRTDQETRIAMGTAGVIHFASRVKGHRGLKCESTCLMDKLDLTSGPGSLWIPSSPPVSSRSASSYIDVPGRRTNTDEVDMDQMMAAMVLSSLSCSPLLQSPAQPDPTVPLVDCGGSELSDSGSSGYWSIGHCNQSPAPSPPRAEPDTSPTSPPEEVLDMELEQVLFDEPAPRRRRNSGKVAFRCLWPNCEKVLISVVGIKRHIRTTHLSRGGEHERCSRSEEDFYYTEIKQRDQQPPSPPLPSSPTSPSPHPLSCSAPPTGSFWQVQSEHSYQAPPPSHLEAHCHSMAPPPTCHRQMFRVRSVSVGEQWLQNQSAPCRRIRGDAKKCRKVYGIEQRDQWCTACRWKKACQRFLD